MTPNPVDIHVGRRLRARRTILGMSQEDLGETAGVTFQQIQKYERGMNRIGSSRLYNFARTLGVNVSYFFDDYSEETDGKGFAEDADTFLIENVDNKEILSLVRCYQSIEDKKVRRKMLSLIRSLSGTDKEDDIELSG